MIDKVRTGLRSHTVRQSAITSISVFLSSGLGAVFYLVLARSLGPHDYGLFALALAILGITISVTDLGITQGLVRFVGSHAENKKYYPYVKLAFKWKLIMGSLVGLVFGVFAEIFANKIFHQPELKSLLPLVGLAIISQLLFTLSTSVFQSLQKFLHWGILQVGANVLRLIFLLPFIFVGQLYTSTSMIVFFLSYLVGFGISLIWLDKDWLSSKITLAQSKEFWDFNRWTAIVAILTSLTSRVDTLLTGRYLTLTDVGVYSLAVTMVSFLPQVASALGAVTTAKFAGMKDPAHEKTYLFKSLFFVGALTIVIALAMIPVSLIVLWLTGRNYSHSFLPFLILLGGTAMFICTNPLRDSILYFYAKPKFFVLLNIVQATAIVVSGIYLIPQHGVLGSAWAVTISLTIAGISTILYYLKLSK